MKAAVVAIFSCDYRGIRRKAESTCRRIRFFHGSELCQMISPNCKESREKNIYLHCTAGKRERPEIGVGRIELQYVLHRQ
jgi:hypothetical protein